MRQVIEALPTSKIREVADAALGRDDVLAFWFGESDEVTPGFIREAAMRSLAEGETFYSHNLGLPELREALARYTSSLHPAVGADRFAVTSSGVNALMLAMQMLAGAGDEVVAVVPVWPNIAAQPAILGARVVRFSLRVEAGAWRLDLEALRPGLSLGQAGVCDGQVEHSDDAGSEDAAVGEGAAGDHVPCDPAHLVGGRAERAP